MTYINTHMILGQNSKGNKKHEYFIIYAFLLFQPDLDFNV